MKGIFNFFILLYLLPLRMSSRLALYIKGKILSHDEHYLVAIDSINRFFPESKGIVIDIGAFDCDSTIFLAKRLKENKILGFEPNPVPYEKGKVNAKMYQNIELYNLGFSNSVGDVDLHTTNNVVSSSLYSVKDFSEISPDKTIKVKVTTMDSFFANYDEILLIKLDIQGAELSVLENGHETLTKAKLVLTEVSIIEMYNGACLYYEVDELLRRNNFRIHTIISNYNKDGLKYFDILYIRFPHL